MRIKLTCAAIALLFVAATPILAQHSVQAAEVAGPPPAISQMKTTQSLSLVRNTSPLRVQQHSPQLPVLLFKEATRCRHLHLP